MELCLFVGGVLLNWRSEVRARCLILYAFLGEAIMRKVNVRVILNGRSRTGALLLLGT
jgi:hypothetical protein